MWVLSSQSFACPSLSTGVSAYLLNRSHRRKSSGGDMAGRGVLSLFPLNSLWPDITENCQTMLVENLDDPWQQGRNSCVELPGSTICVRVLWYPQNSGMKNLPYRGSLLILTNIEQCIFYTKEKERKNCPVLWNIFYFFSRAECCFYYFTFCCDCDFLETYIKGCCFPKTVQNTGFDLKAWCSNHT